MDEYKNIPHYMYYDENTKYVIGVFTYKFPALNDYPFELVPYKLAKPFYYNEKSFWGPFKLVKIKNKLMVIEEKPKSKIEKQVSKFSIYQLNLTENKKVDQNDFIIELKENSIKLIPQIHLDTYPEKGINVFITEKNNPFFLIDKTFIKFNEEKPNTNFKIEKNSFYVKNIGAKISITNEYKLFYNKPFILFYIKELKSYVITSNPQYFSKDNDKNINIEISEKYENKKYKCYDLLNSFYYIKNKNQIVNKAVIEEIIVSINDFPIYWLNVLVKEISINKIIYNEKNIIIFGVEEKENSVYIFPKNNPLRYIDKLSTKSIIKNKFKFEIGAATIKEKEIVFLKCENIK